MTDLPRASSGIPGAFSFLAILVAALNLRAGIASVGPVLGDILAFYGAGGALAGLITALPGFLFAAAGLAAVPLAQRIGVSRCLTCGMMLTAGGLAARPFMPTVAGFLACTVLVVSGIALANVLLPAWIKVHGGRNVVTLMTVNSSVLGISGALGPLSVHLGSWQWAVGVWAGIAGAQVGVWILVARRTGYDFPRSRRPDGGASLWRSPLAVACMGYFGLQSMQAYIQMGWLPQMLLDTAGGAVTTGTASWALSLTALMGILGGLVMPRVIARSRRLSAYPLVFGLLTAAGYLGIWLAPAAAPLGWAVLLGLGGWSFPLALNLIVVKAKDPEIAARLSGFVQPFGYLIAGLGPLAVGLAYSGSWRTILLVLMALGLLKGVLGALAARPGTVDAQL